MKAYYFDGNAYLSINNVPKHYEDIPEGSWLWLDFFEEELSDFVKVCRKLKLDIAFGWVRSSERVPSRYVHKKGQTLLQVKGLDSKSNDIDFDTIRIRFLFNDKVLITTHDNQSMSIEGFHKHIDKGTETPESPLDIVLSVNKKIFERYLPIISNLESDLDDVADNLSEKTNDSVLNDLTLYRLRLKRLRRYSAYHRESFAEMLEYYDAESTSHWHNKISYIIEILERLKSFSQLFYEDCKDLIDGYLSLASHRLNNIMKVLTIVSVLFVPLSFLAGIYGMNFENIPELKFKYGYFVLLGAMITIIVSIIMWLKHKKWY